MCSTHYQIFFPLPFFLIHPFLPPFPSNIFSFPPLTILSLLQVFFFFLHSVLLLHPKDKKKEIYYTPKKKKKKREEAIAAEEESHSRRSPQQQWVYVGIENCTFDLEFCSLVG